MPATPAAARSASVQSAAKDSVFSPAADPAISRPAVQARRGGEAHGVSNLAAPALQHEMPSKSDSSAREPTTTTLGSRKATETLLYARQEIRI
jgi:hypothetical protein